MTRGGKSRHAIALAAALAMASALAALPGCQNDERVVSYKPFLTGLQDAQTQTPAVLTAEHKGVDARATPADKLIVEEADGSKRLVARSGLQLMRHIQRALAEEDTRFLAAEILCAQTRREYVERGLDPTEAYRTLKEREQDIQKLFARMPAGEGSAFVVVTPLGERVKRLRLTPQAGKGLAWTGFDMVLEGARWTPVMEDGGSVVRDGKAVMRFEPSNWRLRWFVD